MPRRPQATTLRELLVELKDGYEQYPPILVEVERLGWDEGSMTREDTITSMDPADWAQNLKEEYAERTFLLLDNPSKPGAQVELTIGRSRSCDVFVHDISVSKRHATLLVDRVAGEFVLQDESSRNGTYVNGERLEPGVRTSIWPGAHIGFGEALFVFLDPSTLKKLASLTG